MAISVNLYFPLSLMKNLTTMKAIQNAAEFVRDLWLARAPHVSGDYARGLMQPGSIKISSGQITITNFSHHAHLYEYGYKSFNIGIAMLASGKNVKISKKGFLYKVIKIEPKMASTFRKDAVAQSVIKNFKETAPLGMKRPIIFGYGGIAKYKSYKTLKKALKSKTAKGGMSGFYTISERTILDNPNRWQKKDLPGFFLARKVQDEARPIIAAVIRRAAEAEILRQEVELRKRPQFKPSMIKNPILGSDVRFLKNKGKK